MPEALRLTSRRIYDLYDPLEPYRTGFLERDTDHALYFEECGRPDGVPVVFLHGGPGAGASPAHRRFFDPEHYRIIIFDQRGAGRSRPLGSIANNTTDAIVGDIEALREHLGVTRWIVFGGSWGSTLALVYAAAFPERVQALVLRGIFLARAHELDWFLFGMRNFFPAPWERFAGHLPVHERHDLLAQYHRRLIDPDPAIHMAAAKAWSSYESACSTLLPNAEHVTNGAHEGHSLGLARIEAHFFMHRLWLAQTPILDRVARLSNIPGTIVQGRYDVVCPPVSAHELAQAWPRGELIIVPDAGHSAFETGIRSELVRVMEELKLSLST